MIVGGIEQVAEGRQEEIQQKGLAEKKELQHKIDEMEEREQELQAKIEALQADNDFTNERLTALQGWSPRGKEPGLSVCLLICEISFSWPSVYSTVRTPSGENS